MLTDEQKQISSLLYEGPKTIEELSKILHLSEAEVSEALSGLLKLKVIDKTDDFPTKYKLHDKIIEKLEKRKMLEEKDEYSIKIKMILDLEGISKEVVEFNLKKLRELLEQEKNITIYELNISDVIEENNSFYGYIDIEYTVKDLATLVYIIMYYAPAAVEVLKPEKITISMFELQDALIELAQRSHSFASELRKRITREETNLLMKKIFKTSHS